MNKNILEFFNILIIITLFSLIGFSIVLADISIQNSFDFGGNYNINNLNTLLFTPTSTAPCDAANTGRMYYSIIDNKPLICDGSGWVDLGGGGGGVIGGGGTLNEVAFFSPDGLTISSDSNLYWDDSNDRLGIGTTNPNAALDVRGKIFLQSDGTNVGELMVDFVNGAYYAVYAP